MTRSASYDVLLAAPSYAPSAASSQCTHSQSFAWDAIFRHARSDLSVLSPCALIWKPVCSVPTGQPGSSCSRLRQRGFRLPCPLSWEFAARRARGPPDDISEHPLTRQPVRFMKRKSFSEHSSATTACRERLASVIDHFMRSPFITSEPQDFDGDRSHAAIFRTS